MFITRVDSDDLLRTVYPCVRRTQEVPVARSVLVSGAGIAGPSLAFWLGRAGGRVTLVERAPALRRGGQAVDFRGPAHMRVLDAMGIRGELEERSTHMGVLRFVDARGRTVFTLPPSFASGELEVERGDLVDVICGRALEHCELVLGDSIASIAQDAHGVDVMFERSAPRRFDLVVGADGLHSRVRALAFGPEPRFVRHLGYCVAAFRAPNFLGLDHTGVVYSERGKAVSVSARSREEAVVMLVHAGKVARDPDALRARFAEVGWETARFLPHVENDLYADDVSRVDVDGFSRGRVVLLGDACTGATVGGQGTGVAVVAAYVLAGELAKTGDHAQAFARYEAAIAKWARGCQENARHMGPFFAPKTRLGLAARDVVYRALTSRLLSGFFERLVASSASDFVVPAYAS